MTPTVLCFACDPTAQTNSPVLKELDSMVRLERVKEAVKYLMHLQVQNFENEMRGDKAQVVSLHRVFYGNPGTG